ncbi:MAG: DUF99 family protein [Candidatus Nanohaloarchaea archaeon]
MKEGSRILGIDDAAFEFEDDKTFLVGVVYRGTEFVEDIVTEEVEVDGYDATEAVISLYRKCKNPGQVKAVLTDGISFAGFNLVDIHEVAEELDVPVIAVTANEPDREDFRATMERTGNQDPVFDRFEEAEPLELKDGTAYIQHAGIELEDARKVVRRTTIHGLSPEAIRVAHMIGRTL